VQAVEALLKKIDRSRMRAVRQLTHRQLLASPAGAKQDVGRIFYYLRRFGSPLWVRILI